MFLALALSLGLVASPAHAGALDRYAETLRAAPIVTEVDAKTAFRDIPFGATCSTIPGFVVRQSAGSMTTYARPTDKLSVGTATLTSITYLCMDDRFRVAIMRAPTESLAPLALALVGAFGKPSIKEENMAYWRGTKRVAWLGRLSEDSEYMASIGDAPWADPVGLLVTILGANRKAGASDL